MRTLLIAAVVAVALAGCAGDNPNDPDPTTPPTGNVAANLPANITDSRNVVGGLDPINGDPTGLGVIPAAPCSSPVTECILYPFTVNETAGNVSMTAELTWTIDANDFDLYFYKDGEQVDVSGQAPPGTSEQIRATLKPGSYEIAVDPYGVAQDTYTLDITFASKA